MRQRNLLQQRLEDIGTSTLRGGKALALLGLGSAGKETHRLDAFSDLDFFVIARNGFKDDFLNDLTWLTALSPVAFCYRNTVDGYKLLYADGVFCEFAVFESAELASIPFAEGRIIWKAEGFDESLCAPKLQPGLPPVRSQEWLIGEILTNLYIGLCRNKRGETLSATRLIQVYPVDRIIEWFEQSEASPTELRDPFSKERRLEKRFPSLARELPSFMQGYGRNCQSAKAILEFIERRHPINAALKELLRHLCEGA